MRTHHPHAIRPDHANPRRPSYIPNLSLGLAPAVVGQLLEIVRRIRDAGTTIYGKLI